MIRIDHRLHMAFDPTPSRRRERAARLWTVQQTNAGGEPACDALACGAA